MTEEEIAAHIVARLDTMDDPAMIEAYRAHPRVVEVIMHWGRTRPDWELAIRSAFFGRLELLRAELGDEGPGPGDHGLGGPIVVRPAGGIRPSGLPASHIGGPGLPGRPKRRKRRRIRPQD